MAVIPNPKYKNVAAQEICPGFCSAVERITETSSVQVAFHLKKVHPTSQSCSQETCVYCSNQLWPQHRWQHVPDGMGSVAEPCTIGMLVPVQLWVQ